MNTLRRLLSRDRLGEILRFGIVGTVAMLIHYAVYYVLMPFTPLNVAYAIGYFLSFLCNFMMSSLFTFRTAPTWRKFLRFGGSHLTNYIIYASLFNLFLFLGLPKEWAPLPVYAIAVPISFILVRLALLRRKP